MKTKLLSLLLTVCMLLTVFPLAVSAEDGEITVTVNIRGDVVHEEGAHTEYTDWLNTTVTVESGTTADAALAAAAEGFTLTGIDTGYIYSVTNPDGITLTAGETNSALSGWMYDVNAISPMVGMSDYVLADGDVVNFFWVDDYNEVYGPVIPEMTFTDVLEGDWFFADVKELFEAGIIAGTSDTTFSPTETLSHGMLLTYLWRIAGAPAMEDVGDEWYAAAVAWAAANGICSTDIDAAALITREDIVTYLYRFSTVAADAVVETKTVSSARMLGVYQDGDTVSDYAGIPVAWALTNKIMRGAVGETGAILLNPTGNATRAEAIALLARLVK